MSSKKRLDQFLVELKIAPSRAKAREMIENGDVEVQINEKWKKISTPSKAFEGVTERQVRVLDDSLLRYVSRGGLKLEGALKKINLSITDWEVFDVGQSTGGFTDCLLKSGAKTVVGIDVGESQLHPALIADTRVISFEGVHVRDMVTSSQLREWLNCFPLVVVDLSFISLQQALLPVQSFLQRPGLLLALVKPQFELDATALNKKGVVKDIKFHDIVKTNILKAAEKAGFEILDYFPCDLKGQDGNQEFFLYAKIN